MAKITITIEDRELPDGTSTIHAEATSDDTSDVVSPAEQVATAVWAGIKEYAASTGIVVGEDTSKEEMN